ncbi:DegT/DnrJ/EryC1/StrS family aminotransferase [Snuella sedimenti]|uniref:DegT/DnrJ/EryC1/StrS family aminotransferase n=1 Tax=Snuella sedimenti TaxID=2798802 RepID=A0A8J7INC2_9FLAO|nr:DegT/DnrJ/EryC1/StrS family aminotransferase [Snuella sedimenti]MBJ6367887.1 DegT/DnrJ/EryC1/StrS family aminotransferase [Snuella sedimenti]
MINVTKTFLPPQEEYQAILKRAWDAGWLTNRGVLVRELEAKLKAYLGVSNILATTNGTLPLQIAIKALGLSGEIITTPFSYVATTSSIVWEGCTPVFVDIHPEYLTIDETKIEAAITSKTSAILATHVFGNPCHVEAIQVIADKYNLKVIYDGAHAFGVTYKGQSLFNYGDISTCSFHATKVFHTGEGGALFCKSSAQLKKLLYCHNFGHDGPENFLGLGINAKISELQGAMGLAVLPYMKAILEARKAVADMYDDAFHGKALQKLKLRDDTQWNYGYYPVVFKSEAALLKVKKALEAEQIFARRYFFPGLNHLPYLKKLKFEVSDIVSTRILCLPMFHDLQKKELEKITSIVLHII